MEFIFPFKYTFDKLKLNYFIFIFPNKINIYTNYVKFIR